MNPSTVTAEDLQDPTIEAEILRRIAEVRPDLRQVILRHPNCHAELSDYVQQLPHQQAAPHYEPYPSANQRGWGYQHQPPYAPGFGAPAQVAPSDERTWGVIMHLGNLFFSFLVPLIIWLIYRERSDTLDQQGRAALNWAISYWIYNIVAGVLALLLVGLIILPVLVVLDIVFCIIAAVKAGNGQPWKYPMSIPFLQVRI